MKNRRYSEISESEDSDEAPRSKISSPAKARVVNNHPSSSSSSDSSSDSEQAPKQRSSLLNQTPPPTSPKKTVSVSPIKKFIEQNPGLTPVHVDDIISEDDDVCFLEIPKTIDPQQLLGRVINFDKRTKLKVDKTRYVIEPNNEIIKPFTILTNKLKVIHPIANLQLREYTKRKSEGGSVESEKFTPTLPDNLKLRHPLFGAKYENKVVLDEEIQQKLDNTIDQFMKKMKKKKKKKHKERVQEEEQEQRESIFTLLESHSTGKKKKRKEQEENERSEELMYMSLNEGGDKDTSQSFKKKHKQKEKKNKETDDEQLKLRSFEEPKDDRRKKEVIGNIVVPSVSASKESATRSSLERAGSINRELRGEEEDRDQSFKKKRKKKKKSETENEELTFTSFKEPEDYKSEYSNTVNNTTISSVDTSKEWLSVSSLEGNSFKKKHKKKKWVEDEEGQSEGKHKKNNLVNSTIIPGLQLPSFSFDISNIMNKEEKVRKTNKTDCADDSGDEFKLDEDTSKKKKSASFDWSSGAKQELIDSFETVGDTSRIKKKKKKTDKFEEEETDVSPKKKRKKDKEVPEAVTNSLILDILSRVKNEMDTPVAKHKKKNKSER